MFYDEIYLIKTWVQSCGMFCVCWCDHMLLMTLQTPHSYSLQLSDCHYSFSSARPIPRPGQPARLPSQHRGGFLRGEGSIQQGVGDGGDIIWTRGHREKTAASHQLSSQQFVSLEQVTPATSSRRQSSVPDSEQGEEDHHRE